MPQDTTQPELHRHFGLLQATALNVTMIVGAGVFITIPYMLLELPGPYALLGWIAGGALMLLDGLVWAELGAALPGSGGSYVYLLESYGRKKWGRAASFLFIWQFLISGPLELGSGLAAIANFSNALWPAFGRFNESHRAKLAVPLGQGFELGITLDAARLFAFGLGALIVVLLYRRITSLGKMTVALWLGVLATIAWVLIAGGLNFDASKAFDFSGAASAAPDEFARRLGATVLMAMYSYLGYYNICYIGDEVKNPGRTIPRAIILSAVIVGVLFVALHLAMLGVVSWKDIPNSAEKLDEGYSLPAVFMRTVHGARGETASTVVTLLLIWCCFGSAFAGLLGYARIPFGAARQGHFFAGLGRIHPTRQFPHVSLLVVGVIAVFWTFFDLDKIIKALVVTRILEQFVAQCIGIMVLRRQQPELPRPYRMWFYPLPALLALCGWLWVYGSCDPAFIIFGLATLVLGIGAFVLWSWYGRTWPFENKEAARDVTN